MEDQLPDNLIDRMAASGKKSLLLCFIHGFKGDEETFFQFPEDLKNEIAKHAPELRVETRVYPKYETRGDLAACVETFKDWLSSQVLTLEKEAGTLSPVQDPSVGVVLVAHSMGGFVAADTLFSILSNRPESAEEGKELMFPLTHGLLTFDTPFNGLSRSLFTYGAINQYQNLSSAWNLISTLSSPFAAISSASAIKTASAAGTGAVVAQNPSWKRWQALAARTGTVGAICAGGVLAWQNREYLQKSLGSLSLPKREHISLDPRKIPYREGWNQASSYVTRDNVSQGLTYVSKESIGEGFAWLAGHLKFVGALMKGAQMEGRLGRLNSLQGVGVRNLYTSLGENGVWSGGYFIPRRTFCAVPVAKEEKGGKEGEVWEEVQNTVAKDEIEAHCSMFRPEKNSSYHDMLGRSGKVILEWQEGGGEVVDAYRPGKEQMERRKSESCLWDDDGKLLKPLTEEGEEEQLAAILGSEEMPEGTDGGVDEETLKRALEVPLPVEEEVEGAVGELTLEETQTGTSGAEVSAGEVEEAVTPIGEVKEKPKIDKTKAAEEKRTLLQKGWGLLGRS